MRSLRQLTVPTTEIVTIEEAKEWCRIDSDDTSQDATLQLLIEAARERAEDITGLGLVRRTFELQLDDFPEDDDPIELRMPPVASIEYIRYIDSAGASQSFDGSPEAWILDNVAMPARVSPLYAVSWPDVLERIGAVQIGYTAGYEYAEQVPKKIRLWIQVRVSTWFDNREAMVMNNIGEAPRDHVDGLLDKARVGSFVW